MGVEGNSEQVTVMGGNHVRVTLPYREESVESSDYEDDQMEDLQTCPAGMGARQFEGILPGNEVEPETNKDKNKGSVHVQWPRGADFFFSSLSFSLSLHSIWSFPLTTIQQGGATFLIIYTLMLVVLGGPLLLLELFLGQYSGQALPPLFRHLTPVARGMGHALCVLALLRTLVDISAAMWLSRLLVFLISDQDIQKNLLYQQVLHKPSNSSLEDLGTLQPELILSIGVVLAILLILSSGGPRALGKVSGVLVVFSYGLLLTLIIRISLTPAGPSGVLTLLAPDWNVFSNPTVWLEAAIQVVLTVQLGLGVQTTLASYSKLRHNIVRDTALLGVLHWVWVMMGTFLVCSLLGVAYETNTAQLRNVTLTSQTLTSTTGEGVWLVMITLLESSLATLSYGWIWAIFFTVLLILLAITSILGYLELLLSSLLHNQPRLLRWRPLFLLLLLSSILLLSLPMTTQGGVHPHHLLQTYLTSWPPLIFALLILLCSLSHGPKHILADLSSMCQHKFSHWVRAHLSVLFYSLLPLFLSMSLGWKLFTLSQDHLLSPLQTFGVTLPPGWGPPLALGLSCLPLLPLLLGLLHHFTFGARGHIWSKHVKKSLRPTVNWHWQQTEDTD